MVQAIMSNNYQYLFPLYCLEYAVIRAKGEKEGERRKGVSG